MKLLFNTSFHLSQESEKEFKDWAKRDYIPAVKNCGIFECPTLLKVLTTRNPEECETYCIQMFSSRPREAMKWLDNEASLLRSKLLEKFDAGKILHFSSSMLVVEP